MERPLFRVEALSVSSGVKRSFPTTYWIIADIYRVLCSVHHLLLHFKEDKVSSSNGRIEIWVFWLQTWCFPHPSTLPSHGGQSLLWFLARIPTQTGCYLFIARKLLISSSPSHFHKGKFPWLSTDYLFWCLLGLHSCQGPSPLTDWLWLTTSFRTATSPMSQCWKCAVLENLPERTLRLISRDDTRWAESFCRLSDDINSPC